MLDLDTNYYEDPDLSGDDPDASSPLLNEHHQRLWSKSLPSGKEFTLESIRNGRLLLRHKSDLGRFVLSSDAIVHSYFYSLNQAAYGQRFPKGAVQSIKSKPVLIKDFWDKAVGIACYTIFPAESKRGQHTINQARGTSGKICDRFDLTLECIRRFYENIEDENPLYEALNRERKFFSIFGSFKGYVDFFLFQDLIRSNYRSIKFWLPFDNFARSPLPRDAKEYQLYKENVCEFIAKRKQRMLRNEKRKVVSK